MVETKGWGLSPRPLTAETNDTYLDLASNNKYVWEDGAWQLEPYHGRTSMAWGAITGTLSDQTDLNTALGGKQDTLVSATNIKTINGNSILGSGDVTIAQTEATVVQVTGTSTTDVMSQKASTDSFALAEDLADYIQVSDTNIIASLTKTLNWFVDPSTGEGRTISTFFSIVNIDISAYPGENLYPRSDIASIYNTARCIVFYGENNTFISGAACSASLRDYGIAIPSNAKYCSVTFTNEATVYTLSVKPRSEVSFKLNNKIKVNYSQINGIENQKTDQIRYPVINFQFDDGHANDSQIVTIFNNNNAKCGFALLSTVEGAVMQSHLDYQSNGFEILSHSTDGTVMSDESVAESVIENKLKTSKEVLESKGFIINGWVTPSSNMAVKFRHILRKYYQYATTQAYGTYSATGEPYNTSVTGVYNLYRVSLETTTLVNQKLAVDNAIRNNGCLTFYGHSANLDSGNYLTTSNMNELLAYINSKVSDNQCKFGTPYDMICYYFNVRNDDVSNGWIDIPYTSVNVDPRLIVHTWKMQYNPKLKLFSFFARLKANTDIAGPFYVCDIPVNITGGWVVQSEMSRTILFYEGKVSLISSGTWSNGATYRMSEMCPYDSLIN